MVSRQYCTVDGRGKGGVVVSRQYCTVDGRGKGEVMVSRQYCTKDRPGKGGLLVSRLTLSPSSTVDVPAADESVMMPCSAGTVC